MRQEQRMTTASTSFFPRYSLQRFTNDKHAQRSVHRELGSPRNRPRAALTGGGLPVSTLHVSRVDLNGALGRLAPFLLPNPLTRVPHGVGPRCTREAAVGV